MHPYRTAPFEHRIVQVSDGRTDAVLWQLAREGWRVVGFEGGGYRLERPARAAGARPVGRVHHPLDSKPARP
jgi:hypothetical protein